MSEMVKTDGQWYQTSGNSNQAELDSLKQNFAHIGEIYEATLTARSLTAKTWTSVANITLPKGTYIVEGTIAFNSSSSTSSSTNYISLSATTGADGTREVGSYGFTYGNITSVFALEEETTINLCVFVGNAQQVTPRALKATRIK